MRVRKLFSAFVAQFAKAELEKRIMIAMKSATVINSGEMADANAETIYSGKRSDNTRIGPRYSPRTRTIKARKSQPFDRVTLRDTKAFHDSIKVAAGQNSLTYSATDEKTPKLLDKYGDEVLGLSASDWQKQFRDEYTSQLIGELRRKIKKQ